MVSCRQDTAPSADRPHPVLKRYEWRVHTMNELMVSFQRRAGSADDDINYVW